MSTGELFTFFACIAGAVYYAELAVQRWSARKEREQHQKRIDAVMQRRMPFQGRVQP